MGGYNDAFGWLQCKMLIGHRCGGSTMRVGLRVRDTQWVDTMVNGARWLEKLVIAVGDR